MVILKETIVPAMSKELWIEVIPLFFSSRGGAMLVSENIIFYKLVLKACTGIIWYRFNYSIKKM